MRATRYYLIATPVGIALMLTLACDQSPAPITEPVARANGQIEVTVATTGPQRDVDSDGYTLIVDARVTQRLDVNAKLTVVGLRGGRHSVELGDLQANCLVEGTNRRPVDVVGDAAVSLVSFSVSCADRGAECAGCWDY